LWGENVRKLSNNSCFSSKRQRGIAGVLAAVISYLKHQSHDAGLVVAALLSILLQLAGDSAWPPSFVLPG